MRCASAKRYNKFKLKNLWVLKDKKRSEIHIESADLFLKKNGKLPKSHRYNRLPLLRSHPGGFSGAGCLGLAVAKIRLLLKTQNRKLKILTIK